MKKLKAKENKIRKREPSGSRQQRGLRFLFLADCPPKTFSPSPSQIPRYLYQHRLISLSHIDAASTKVRKFGSPELLPQSDIQLLSEHKRGLLQRIQSDRDILWV